MLITFFWFGILLSLVYITILLMKLKKKESILNCFLFSLFYLYIALLLKIVFFPIPINLMGFDANYNFIPFTHLTLRNVIGNILLFIPLGCYLPLAYEKFRSFIKILIMSFLCSCSIEITQGIIGIIISRRYRVVDINDVIFNVIGALIGFVLYKILIVMVKKIQITD